MQKTIFLHNIQFTFMLCVRLPSFIALNCRWMRSARPIRSSTPSSSRIVRQFSSIPSTVADMTIDHATIAAVIWPFPIVVRLYFRPPTRSALRNRAAANEKVLGHHFQRAEIIQRIIRRWFACTLRSVPLSAFMRFIVSILRAQTQQISPSLIGSVRRAQSHSLRSARDPLARTDYC